MAWNSDHAVHITPLELGIHSVVYSGVAPVHGTTPDCDPQSLWGWTTQLDSCVSKLSAPLLSYAGFKPLNPAHTLGLGVCSYDEYSLPYQS